MKAIEFKFITKQSPDWQHLDIGLEEYFDLETGERITVDSVPRYLHLDDYVDVAIEDLLFIHVSIKVGKDKKEFKQTFWNNGDNFCTERIDTGKTPYKEIIINSLIDKKKQVYEIIRIVYAGSQMYPVYHGFIRQREGKADTEKKLNLDLYANLYKQTENYKRDW